MLKYCHKCDGMKEITLSKVEEEYPVKGEPIVIDAEVAICSCCGEQVFSEEHDDNNLNAAYAVYRKKHNLLFPSDITLIRQKYNLSQRALGKLLDWGEITVNRYENGALPDPAHNEVLSFIKEPFNMKQLFEKNGSFLPASTREKLQLALDQLIDEEITPKFFSSLEEFISLKKRDVDEYSGFSTFDLYKMLAMVQYIVKESGGTFKTKLNKLLWYADFCHFKNFSRSISGSHYVHLQYGPVPDNYDWIYTTAIAEGLLSEEEVCFPNGDIGYKFVSLQTPTESFFTSEEIETMKFIVQYFANVGAKDIKDRSHKERAYTETNYQETISYKFACDIDYK